VLTAIRQLHGEGYSVSITRKVSEMAGREVMLGSTFVSLGRLERSGLISAWVPESDPEGKSRRYWTVTLAGERALATAADTAKIVAEYLGGLA
jgi:DNA-binding PadR family transcriptional regulator